MRKKNINFAEEIKNSENFLQKVTLLALSWRASRRAPTI
jgi:hypothetical protein